MIPVGLPMRTRGMDLKYGLMAGRVWGGAADQVSVRVRNHLQDLIRGLL